MKLYKSNEPNTFHYVTMVTHNQSSEVPIEVDWRAYWKEEELETNKGVLGRALSV